MKVHFEAVGALSKKSLLAGALSLAMIAGGAASQVLAQDGTNGSTPAPAPAERCQLTAAANASSTPDASPIASPVVATSATPQASPVVAAGPEIAEMESAATVLFDCLSVGDYETLATITSDEWRGQFLGMESPLAAEDFLALSESLPTLAYELVTVRSAEISGDTATAEIEYTVANQLRLSEFTFAKQEVDGQDVWTVESESPKAVEAPQGAETVTVTISDGTYDVKPASVNGTDVEFEITNDGDEVHEVLVLKLEDGTSTDDVLASPAGLPDGATYVGQVTVPAGESATLVLTDLEGGTYTIVDLLPNESGMPNLSDGMTATFDVED